MKVQLRKTKAWWEAFTGKQCILWILLVINFSLAALEKLLVAFGLAEQPAHLESDPLVGAFFAWQLQNIMARQRPVPASTWLYLLPDSTWCSLNLPDSTWLYLSSLGCWVMAHCDGFAQLLFVIQIYRSRSFATKYLLWKQDPHHAPTLVLQGLRIGTLRW